MSKGSAIVGFLLCFLGGMALMWGIDRSTAGHQSETDIHKESATFAKGNWNDAAAAVPVSSKDPNWGSRTAPATIVIYSDFECPYCSKVVPTIAALKEKYGPKQLRVVWKNFPLPFHKKAMGAHIAAQTVFELGGSKAFWKFHDLAFQNARALTPENLEAWAGQSGVDKAKFKAAFAAKKGKAKVDADMANGKAAGIRGTPAFMVNGIFISGARPKADFEKEIDKQLAEAKKLIAAGTPADKVYVQLTNKNKAKTPPKKDDKKPAKDDKTVWKVPVHKDNPVKGNPEALVTIVEFSEYQCPFCSRVNPTIKKLMDTYGDKVRIIFMDNPLPFHKRATPASMLAHEAKAQKG
ncbi:MAG: thioredoxin domain-containing protein, partial [Deltaproteobacteria bacterium]|nr:thioredoxin domain-containing protein [Deltaproteobacteria bacterium]